MRDSSEVAFNLQAELKSAQSELAALREELAEYQKILLSYKNSYVTKLAYNAVQSSLTAAEQRNAELVELLRELDENWNSHDGRERFTLAMRKVEAALKPTESGASDAERKEDDRWLQMKDDQERADYFDGSGASE